MEFKLVGETEVLGENLPQRHFCPSQNPTWPDPGLNPCRGSRRLIAWAMARPSSFFLSGFSLMCCTYLDFEEYYPCRASPTPSPSSLSAVAMLFKMYHRGSVVVKALCCKPEGRGFKSRWGGFF
jgi:hypothetical protein